MREGRALAERCLIVTAILLVSLTGLSLVGAEKSERESEQAKELAGRGFDAYDDDDYARAISLFEHAHAIAPVPGLLYNIAQSYRLLGDSGCEAAHEYYRRYRSEMKAAGVRTKKGVRARIAEMEQCIEDLEEEAEESEPLARDTEEAEPESFTREEAEPGYLPDELVRNDEKHKDAWMAIGLGATSIVVSSVTGMLALDRESELELLCESSVCAAELRNRVKSYDRMRYTSYATGAIGVAALVGGAWLLLSDSSRESRDASSGRVSTRATPWVGHRSAGVQWNY